MPANDFSAVTAVVSNGMRSAAVAIGRIRVRAGIEKLLHDGGVALCACPVQGSVAVRIDGIDACPSSH